MAQLDATDFRILNEIYRTKSVSAAVQNVGLGQPSISIRLGKLRQHFNDPLFVRTSEGMQPTPRLEALMPDVLRALALCAGDTGLAPVFDPAGSRHTFRICMTDVGQTVVLPRLVSHLQANAPQVQIEALNFSAETGRMLETGDADIAMGFTLDIPSPFYQQRLFEERFVCMVNRQHPRIGDQLTLHDFLNEQHVEVVLPRGTGHWVLNKSLQDQGIQREVVLRVPSFLGLASIVAHSDLIALAPIHLARSLSNQDDIKLLRPPVPLPSYDVKQYWHERYHRDPANQWLRQLINELFAH